MKKGDLKKLRQRATTSARADIGAMTRNERNINITDREWEAIQAGAISKTKLTKILNNTDTDKLRERAMPKATSTLSAAKLNTARQMRESNYTLDEIAKKLGVSPTTISKALKGEK